MKRLSIGNKIMLGFVFILLLCISVVIMAKMNLDSLGSSISFLQEAQFPALKRTHEMTGQFRLATQTILQIGQSGKNADNERMYQASRDNCRGLVTSITG